MLFPLKLVSIEVMSQHRMGCHLTRVLLPFGVALADGDLCSHASLGIDIGAEQGAGFVNSASGVKADSE